MSQQADPQWYTQSMTEVVADMIAFQRSRGGDIGFKEALFILCDENKMIEVYDRYMTGELDLDDCIVDVFDDGSLELFNPNRQEDDDE